MKKPSLGVNAFAIIDNLRTMSVLCSAVVAVFILQAHILGTIEAM
jgi:hypothetical protein